MNSPCEKYDARLLALVLDEIDEADRAGMTEHLEGCERCRRELETLRGEVALVREHFEASQPAELRLSPGRIERLRGASVESLPDPRRNLLLSWQPWALAATLIFGLIAFLNVESDGSLNRRAGDEGAAPLLEKSQSAMRSGELDRGSATEAKGLKAGESLPMPAPFSGAAGGRPNLDSKDELSAVPMNEVRREAEFSPPQRQLKLMDKKAEVGEEVASKAKIGNDAPQKVAEFSASNSAPLHAEKEIQIEGEPPASTIRGQVDVRDQRRVAGAPMEAMAATAGKPAAGVMIPRPMPPVTPPPDPSLPNDAEVDAMYFQNYGVNPFIETAEDPLSTFAIDVDTASCTIARNYLGRGMLPPPEAVRVEEFVNYFAGGDPAPRRDTFAVYSEMAASPFRPGYQLLRIGIRGREIPPRERKPVVLTFVVDVSGSMAREDRLGLVKQTLRELLRELHPGDRVGLAIYGSRGEEVLSPTEVSNEGEIERGIDSLRPGGSTNAEEGLRIGYGMARRAFDPEGVNRVILCTDGVANVGRTGADSILDVVGREADDRIFLTAIGFGMGNFNDVLLEQLADRGNGNYAYVDSEEEARNFVRHRLADSMEVIAQDVKIQVELDPESVDKYRLLGYENRDIADRDFRNDRVDAGEVGSGHSVTALYEIRLTRPGARNLGEVRIRFKDPEGGLNVREIEGKLDLGGATQDFEEASDQFRRVAIAAQLAEVLRKSYWARDYTMESLLHLFDESFPSEDQDEALADLRSMISEAANLLPGPRPYPVPMGVAEPQGAIPEDDGPQVPMNEVLQPGRRADDAGASD